LKIIENPSLPKKRLPAKAEDEAAAALEEPSWNVMPEQMAFCVDREVSRFVRKRAALLAVAQKKQVIAARYLELAGGDLAHPKVKKANSYAQKAEKASHDHVAMPKRTLALSKKTGSEKVFVFQ